MVVKKYLHSPKPGYVYVRKGGKYLGRILAPIGTREFDAEYWAILSGKRKAKKYTYRELIESYRCSQRWAGLASTTRAGYDRVFDYLNRQNGSKSIVDLTRSDIIAGMEANREKSAHFANQLPAILSILCEHAIDLGWMKHNPARGVRKFKVPKDRQQPHVPWTDEAVALWRAKASEQARLIFEVGVGSVQRPGDWVGFRWCDYDGHTLRLTQNKTGVSLLLPCTAQLSGVLDRQKRVLGYDPAPQESILVNRSGNRFTYSGMQQLMRKERVRLGLEKYDLHALRYRGVMELAWAGCTDDEIASFSGHATTDMIRKYAGQARQITNAKKANRKRESMNEPQQSFE